MRYWVLFLLTVLVTGCGVSDPEVDLGLPDISLFQTAPSDRFLVDASDVDAGHPFKGIRANVPHTGAHVHFDNTGDVWPKGGSAPWNYIPVYAVADGVIVRVTEYFQVGANYRYGLTLAFAEYQGSTLALDYSLEPFVDPGDSAFYLPFLQVEQDEVVQKGDVIAYLYAPPNGGLGTHIHFQLSTVDGNGDFMAPAIFTTAVVSAFHARWTTFADDGPTPMPACMGYLLGASENPFDSAEADCL